MLDKIGNRLIWYAIVNHKDVFSSFMMGIEVQNLEEVKTKILL